MNSDSATPKQVVDSATFSNISIAIDSLPKVEEVHIQNVSPKYKSIHHMYSIVFALVLGGITISISMGVEEVSTLFLFMGVSVAVLLAIARILFIHLAYPWKGYAVRERDVLYQSGLIWRKLVVIPFSRIQHGELSEGIVDRQFGLAKLRLYTAGGSSSDLSIPAIPKEEAERLREFIMKRVIEEGEEASSDSISSAE